ncbi:MAG: ATP-binding protein, partial [Sphingomicrobium sp.]
MSHVIRTPMTGVLGMIDLLRSDPEDADRDRYFSILKQSASLLMTVLDDVLDYSKIESGNLALDEVGFEPEEVARSAIALFSNGASQKGLLLSMHCDCAPGSIVAGDPVRLQQVISNLIGNAIKFTERGRVTLNVRICENGAGGRIWRFEVRDTGIGIADEHLETLFQPFVQAEMSTSRRFGGTGLGLSISRWLVQAMGGHMGVESRVRRGSLFWFEVPLRDAIVADWHAPPSALPPASRPLDVLVAEDNPVNQMLIEVIVRRLGHQVTLVENGRQAVDAATERTFDCILMDMQMPEMDGLAATRAIRALPGPAGIVPIIALTADASPERRRFYDNVGLTDFLTKPIDSLALATRLAAIVTP